MWFGDGAAKPALMVHGAIPSPAENVQPTANKRYSGKRSGEPPWGEEPPAEVFPTLLRGPPHLPISRLVVDTGVDTKGEDVQPIGSPRHNDGATTAEITTEIFPIPWGGLPAADLPRLVTHTKGLVRTRGEDLHAGGMIIPCHNGGGSSECTTQVFPTQWGRQPRG